MRGGRPEGSVKCCPARLESGDQINRPPALVPTPGPRAPPTVPALVEEVGEALPPQRRADEVALHCPYFFRGRKYHTTIRYNNQMSEP